MTSSLYFLAFTLLIQFQTCLAVPHQARTVNDILSGLQSINNQLDALSASLRNFNGGLQGTLAALQIQGQTMDLVHIIDNATGATNGTSNLNQAESITITNRVVQLQDDIFSTLDLLEEKKPAFDTAVLGLASASILVRADLEALQSSTRLLGNAIVQRLVMSLRGLGPLITGNIDFHFSHALRHYA
ncbi:hypothetical protein ASPCAL12148 [Aspergillus calidoustus]|uniref:Uncharacterized protein n=1 Tax=Aspergillus calidoustus TaxID=454130 RepID=A0A0U5CFE1_ASPCI|nr:hypothetical protein ASPCAL12148 [Aspergillus calidoustus]